MVDRLAQMHCLERAGTRDWVCSRPDRKGSIVSTSCSGYSSVLVAAAKSRVAQVSSTALGPTQSNLFVETSPSLGPIGERMPSLTKADKKRCGRTYLRECRRERLARTELGHRLLESGSLQPVVYNEQFTLEQVSEALVALEQRKTWGKAILTVREEDGQARL